MKPILKKFFATVSIVSCLLGTNLSVNAAESHNSATYNLEIGGTQTFNVTDSFGNDATITIEELPSATRSLENRSYKVSYRSLLAWEAGYNVVIRNNSISSVNSPYYICYIGEITSPTLIKNSSKQATFAFFYKVAGIAQTTGVRTNIVNEELKVTVL